MITLAEENYLKAILKLSKNSKNSVSTNAIADELETKASSVTDMIKKLTDKHLVDYVPYRGVSLSKFGLSKAIEIVRKHRLWEVFLVTGKFPKSFSKRLSEIEKGSIGQVVGVSQDNQSFLQYLNSLNITLGTSISVIQRIDFDKSLEITINNKSAHISNDVARNILIKQK